MSSTAFAAENVSDTNDTMFSYCNDVGEIVTISISHTDTIAMAKVYVDGILDQKAIADATTKSIETEIYDLSSISSRSIQPQKGTMNGFTTSVVHLPVSAEKIDITNTVVQARSIYDEPVDNSGLSSSGYNDGYYFLGSHGGYYYAPDVYGYLYRSYTSTYDGETKHWSWSAGDTVSAISAYISLFGGPVSAIISVLLFTTAEVLAYNQSVDLATYTYDYRYRVRVYGDIYFTTERNITYWRIDNVTEGTTKWDEKSFNYGFSMANSEMVKAGIDDYLVSIQ